MSEANSVGFWLARLICCASSISIGPVVANSWSVPKYISSLGGLPFWGFFRASGRGLGLLSIYFMFVVKMDLRESLEFRLVIEEKRYPITQLPNNNLPEE